MAGKTCLVTGATAGIGRVTATALAAQGAEVIIVGRNQPKTEYEAQQIQSESGSTAVHYLLADFADLQQIRDLAAAFKRQYAQLDVLVNNAGAFFNSRQATPYGVEMTLLVNHLAPFLLTHLLLEKLQASASARIVNVSSDAHKQDRMDFDDLGFEKGYFGIKAYGRSKLANIFFTYELARRLENSSVTVNALHPGHVATDIWKSSFPLLGPVIKWVLGWFALTPEEGADNSIYLATSGEVATISGKYFVKRQPTPSSAISYDEEIAKKLWQISADLVGLTQI